MAVRTPQYGLFRTAEAPVCWLVLDRHVRLEHVSMTEDRERTAIDSLEWVFCGGYRAVGVLWGM